MLMKQNAATYWEEWTTAVGEGWNQFWFAPASSKPLSLIRIMTGLLLVVYFLSYNGDLLRWFAGNSLMPPATVRNLTSGPDIANYHYTLLALVNKPSELWIFHSIGIVAAVCLAIGLFSRAAAGVALVMLLSYVHRAPMISGLAEPILAPLLFYLCFAPSGEWFGVNAWLKNRQGTEEPQPSLLAGLSLRMIQVHLAALVFMMGMSKLSQENWWTGDAVWYLLAQTRSRPFDLSFLRKSPFLINAWTHLIVGFEIAFPILIWNRFARPILLILGVLVWLSIAIAAGHLLFALTMITASLAFWQLGSVERTGPALAR
jgi:hypothetical protein